MKKSQGVITLIAAILIILGFGYMVIYGVGSEKAGAADQIKLGLDLAGGVSITYQVEGENPSASDMSDTIYKLQKRVEGYSTEAQVYQEGTDRINIEIPGVSDANAILEELGKPGSLYFISEKNNAGEVNYTFGETGYVLSKSLEELEADGSIVLTGTDVKAAQAGSSQDDMGNSQYVVELTMTPDGAKKFADATTIAAITHEVIFIVYDGEIISAPTVESAITGGQAFITKISSFEQAESLASTIRIGGLKLTLTELRSNVVGAQLGSEAIKTSIKAGIIGFIIVILFMLVTYLVPGLASALALFIYVTLMMLSLEWFDITLTLPGVAGIILSIGMAVDANVIIFARIKEEIATGKTVRSAIKIGYQKALSAIIDGNVTTLIAALVLGFMGTGAIKGFAQTLALGIILSMFTAVFVSKLILNALFALGLQSEKLYGTIKARNTIAFLSKRRIFIAISAIVILCGFVFMGINKA
ncbi:MAG: protein translocase subunit SecD, partial [Clostridia bacterium]|nr:protein translocase subunit SecD [Clostridia bacterium]